MGFSPLLLFSVSRLYTFTVLICVCIFPVVPRFLIYDPLHSGYKLQHLPVKECSCSSTQCPLYTYMNHVKCMCGPPQEKSD